MPSPVSAKSTIATSAVLPRGNSQGTTHRGMTEGVDRKIQNDLLQAIGIALISTLSISVLSASLIPACSASGRMNAIPFCKTVSQLQANVIGRSVSVKLQNIVDGRRERADAGLQMLDAILSLLRRSSGLLVQHAGPQFHAAQRIADFVCQDCGHLAQGQHVARRFALLFGFLARGYVAQDQNVLIGPESLS